MWYGESYLDELVKLVKELLFLAVRLLKCLNVSRLKFLPVEGGKGARCAGRGDLAVCQGFRARFWRFRGRERPRVLRQASHPGLRNSTGVPVAVLCSVFWSLRRIEAVSFQTKRALALTR